MLNIILVLFSVMNLNAGTCTSLKVTVDGSTLFIACYSDELMCSNFGDINDSFVRINKNNNLYLTLERAYNNQTHAKHVFITNYSKGPACSSAHEIRQSSDGTVTSMVLMRGWEAFDENCPAPKMDRVSKMFKTCVKAVKLCKGTSSSTCTSYINKDAALQEEIKDMIYYKYF